MNKAIYLNDDLVFLTLISAITIVIEVGLVEVNLIVEEGRQQSLSALLILMESQTTKSGQFPTGVKLLWNKEIRFYFRDFKTVNKLRKRLFLSILRDVLLVMGCIHATIS